MQSTLMTWCDLVREHSHTATKFTRLGGEPMSGTAIGTITDDDLRERYAYPVSMTRPWLRLNFVSSIDGAATVDGVSGGLGTPADKRVFGVLRELADVVLVGAGTARAEDYGGARVDEAQRERRLARGLAAVPPIAVLTRSARLDPESRLFNDTAVAPIVLTTSAAPVAPLRRAGAQIVAVEGELTSAAILAALADLGLLRVLCEGGPSLSGQFIGDDVVDELCLTTSPVLVAGGDTRIARSASAVKVAMTRGHVLLDDDGTVLTRWVRARPPT
ncbi:MAG TPA: pyrimidine reductase family protein [Aldersonia sp.]